MLDIIFIQEPFCYFIYNLSNNTNSEGDLLYGASKYPE